MIPNGWRYKPFLAAIRFLIYIIKGRGYVTRNQYWISMRQAGRCFWNSTTNPN